MTTTDNAKQDGELLYGAAAIAKFLGIKRTQTYHLISAGGLPSFKMNGTVCARPARLRAWIAEREAAGRGQPAPTEGA